MQWYIYIYTNNLWAHKMRHCFKNSTLFMGKERSVLAFLDSKARWRAHVTPPKCILPQTTITSYALFFVPPGPWLPPPPFFFFGFTSSLKCQNLKRVLLARTILCQVFTLSNPLLVHCVWEYSETSRYHGRVWTADTRTMNFSVDSFSRGCYAVYVQVRKRK